MTTLGAEMMKALKTLAVILTAAALAGCGGSSHTNTVVKIIDTAHVSMPASNDIVVGDIGFGSPLAALRHLINGVATGNFDSGAQACPTISLAQHYNWTDAVKAADSWNPGESYWPTQYRYWRQANAIMALSQCMVSMRALASRLVAPRALNLESPYVGDAQTLAKQLNPAALSDLRVVRFDRVQFAGPSLRALRRTCVWEGGQQCTSDLALLQVRDSYWLIGPSFVEYDGKWRLDAMDGLAGELLGVSADGTLRVSKARYATDLADLRHTASHG